MDLTCATLELMRNEKPLKMISCCTEQAWIGFSHSISSGGYIFMILFVYLCLKCLMFRLLAVNINRAIMNQQWLPKSQQIL